LLQGAPHPFGEAAIYRKRADPAVPRRLSRAVRRDPNLFVVARLLERLWRKRAPIVKTRLQVAANVNYDIFSKYLAWCLARGLVALEDSPDGHERVTITEKGKSAYRRQLDWLNDYVHGRGTTPP